MLRRASSAYNFWDLHLGDSSACLDGVRLLLDWLSTDRDGLKSLTKAAIDESVGKADRMVQGEVDGMMASLATLIDAGRATKRLRTSSG